MIQKDSHDRTPANKRGVFHWTIRVYYEDTDALGIVYHANYLRYFERARTEWLRFKGFQQSELARDWGIHFVLASATLKFMSSARLDDELEVSVSLQRVGRASLDFQQNIHCRRSDQTLVTLIARVGCLDTQTSRPRAIPPEILRELVHDD